jgi:hypothetical protein
VGAGCTRRGRGDDTAGPAFALALVVYFVVSGFLVAYLWTRLNLTGAFARAEASVLKSYVDTSIKAMAETVDERVGSVERDVLALSLAERQLDPESDAVPDEQLREAITAASPAVKAQIFARARTQRSTSWRTDKPRMERTIPLFRALVASDPERRYHRNFGQLGFALKDKADPDFEGAVEMLTEAIRIRGEGRAPSATSSTELWPASARTPLPRQTACARKSSPTCALPR